VVEAAVVSAQVSVTEGVAIEGEGAELWIVAWGVVIGACGAGMEGQAVGCVAFAVAATGEEAVAITELNDGRSFDGGWWRRWWRRIMVSTADSCKKCS
jgi:hypothetical protein